MNLGIYMEVTITRHPLQFQFTEVLETYPHHIRWETFQVSVIADKTPQVLTVIVIVKISLIHYQEIFIN